jgi:predicted  nucleic acid-binding Zn-ribbon protein
MHPSIQALFELHEVTTRRQSLSGDLEGRKTRLAKAKATVHEAESLAELAEREATDTDALIRQYTSDAERCDATIQRLRTQQMEAKSNKEYLAIINGIEEARNELKLRRSSLADLGAKVADRRAAATAARAKVVELQQRYEAFAAQHVIDPQMAASIARLDEIYAEKQRAVDPRFLEVYERLVKSGNRMPLVPIDPVSRATPLGSVISQNQMEQIRNGLLVLDQMTNGILFINEQ